MSLAENGYVILNSVFTEEQLIPVRRLTDEIISYADKGLVDPFRRYYHGHRSDQGAIYDLYQRHPEFQEFAKNARVLDAIEEVVGSTIFLYVNSLVFKPKGRNNVVPWHQDFISRPNEPIKYIAWMALDDANRENGCMKVIPGSHAEGAMKWHRVKGETHHDRVDPEHVDESKTFYCEVKAGDVLIFHNRLLHSSELSDSEKPRRAYRVAYQGLQDVRVPRGAPIVLRGGHPEDLASVYSASEQDGAPPKYKQFLHRVGNRLQQI